MVNTDRLVYIVLSVYYNVLYRATYVMLSKRKNANIVKIKGERSPHKIPRNITGVEEF